MSAVNASPHCGRSNSFRVKRFAGEGSGIVRFTRLPQAGGIVRFARKALVATSAVFPFNVMFMDT